MTGEVKPPAGHGRACRALPAGAWFFWQAQPILIHESSRKANGKVSPEQG